MGFYYNEDWESFRAVTIAFDRLLGVNKVSDYLIRARGPRVW